MSHPDSTYFFQGQETDPWGVIWTVKRRLLRNVCKKTRAFFSWSIEEKCEIDPATSQEALRMRAAQPIIVADSGIQDFTSDGSFFGLTEEQKSRALEKRITIPR